MKLYSLRRRHFQLSIALGLVALFVRLAFVVFYPASSLAGGDPTAYWTFAQSIAAGDGFRSSFEPWLADRPPFYPYFLAGVFLLFGESRTLVFMIQALFGSIAAVAFYLCAARLLDDARALPAGTLFALCPHFLLFTNQILTETIYVVLVTLLLTAILLPEMRRRMMFLHAVLIGGLLGLIALTRREAILPIGLLTVVLLWLRLWPDRRRFAIATIGLALAVVLALTPWLVRNQRVLGKPVLSSSAGINFMVGNNPLAAGGYTPPPAAWDAALSGVGELERNRLAWQLSLQWIRTDPQAYMRLLFLKLQVLFGPAHNLVLDGFDLLLIPLYILGLLHLGHREENWPAFAALIGALVGGIVLIALIFVGGWRYRLIIYPALLLLAAYGLPISWRILGKRPIVKEMQSY